MQLRITGRYFVCHCECQHCCYLKKGKTKLVINYQKLTMALFQGLCSRKSFDSTSLYNTYYQWVSIFLMLQVRLNHPL